MVQPQPLELLESLRTSTSIEQQIQSLGQLKNSIVGHEQRKELVVQHGGLDILTGILEQTVRSHDADSSQSGQSNGSNAASTDMDKCRLQATMILGSLAAGGAPYVAPMIAAGTTRHLLAAMHYQGAPKLVTATLQAVQNFAASWSAALESGLASELYRLGMLDQSDTEALIHILSQPQTRHTAQQLTLACEIVTLSAQDPCDDETRTRLAHCGLLDTLAALLVSHSIRNKHIDYRSDTSHLLPGPPATVVPSILSAISAIISGSTYRTHRFILSEPVKDLFMNFAPGEGDLRYIMGPKHGLPNANGSLLPPLYIPASKSVSFPSNVWPVLNSMNRQNGSSSEAALPSADMDHANAVTGWLLFFVRSFAGLDRVKALRLLALVSNAIELDASAAGTKSELAQKAKERERQLCLLAVPLAVRLIMDANEEKSNGSPKELAELAEVQEQACEVFAMLISGNKDLQVTAVEAGSIKAFCPILKKSFDNVPLAKPMWSAKSASSNQIETSDTCRLGSKGLPKEIMHAMRCRKGALDAVAAIAQKEDVHRKAIVDSGVVTCIIDSLKPFSCNLEANIKSNKGQLSSKDGNTPTVILAACHAAKSMSRSVSLLRTSLIDAGIAKPISELLKHPDHDIQLAATNVMANLLLDFSPMRDDLVADGVVRTLCDHAKRSSPSLRLSSLWALKHLMYNAPKDLKQSTLEELGTGWLVSAIAGEQKTIDISTSGGGVSVGLSTSNAAGEQVNLLNPSSMDVDDPDTLDNSDNLDDDSDEDDEDGEVMYDEPSNTHYQSSGMRSTLPPTSDSNTTKYLSSVQELEQNPLLRARREDIAIQEQALDFLRNLINGEDCATMIDALLQAIGHQKLFDLLTSKLAPLPNTRPRDPHNSTQRHSHQPAQLILATIYVLVHLANGSPQHKHMLISQRPLLQAWLPHFTHADHLIRVTSVWAVNSLTWMEDERDRSDARARASELRNVGIDAAVRSLVNDANMDVRERVRTALRQIEGL